MPFATLIEEPIALVAEDALALDWEAEVAHARTIVERGTSADRQVTHFAKCKSRGASREEALGSVVDLLIAETAEGL